jgi:glycopeptide antibiotics resistance protein
MANKKLSLGKKLGLIAFVISETLVILLIIGMLPFFKYISTDILPALLTFQGSVFVTVFAGVSTKNFKKINEVEQ